MVIITIGILNANYTVKNFWYENGPEDDLLGVH